MLTHPTVAKLEHMRLFGMANALRDQLVTADMDELTFTDRLALMVDNEMAVRDSRRLAQRLGRARLKHQPDFAILGTNRGRRGAKPGTPSPLFALFSPFSAVFLGYMVKNA